MTEVTVDNTELRVYLQRLDKELKAPISIVAFGGTALMLVGLKGSSEDIDLIVNGDKRLRDKIKTFLREQAGTRIDICPKGEITPFYKLPLDYQQRSIEIPGLNLKNVKLTALDPLDVLVSKIGRYNSRDRDDVRRIIAERHYSFSDIQTRFGFFLRGYQKDKKQFMDKFVDFERIYHDEYDKK